MKIYMIGLSFVLIVAYYMFDINQIKSPKFETSSPRVLQKIDKPISSMKNTNKEVDNIQLEQIMSTKVEEPAATEMWNWLMKHGFEHPESIERLNYLFLVNGVSKYYKELLAILKTETLSIDARSAIISSVTPIQKISAIKIQ